MNRWISVMGLSVLSLSLIHCQSSDSNDDPPAQPPQPSGNPRLIIVDSAASEPYETARQSMMQTLSDGGYVEGDSLDVEYHAIDNDEAVGRDILATPAASTADLIVVNGTIAARAAKETLWGEGKVPMVFLSVTDPVGEELIGDFDTAPPANMTGVSFSVPIHTRFNVIKRRFPHDPAESLHIGLIHTDMPQSRDYRRLIEEAMAGTVRTGGQTPKTYAPLSGLTFHFREVAFVGGDNGLDAMVEAAKAHVTELDDVVDLFVSPSDILGTSRPYAQMVFETASKPLVGLGRDDVVEGWGAMGSIYPSVEDIGQQAGAMAVRLLKGTAVSEVFPETPQRTGFALDLKKTEGFGIEVDPEILKLIRPEDLVQ